MVTGPPAVAEVALKRGGDRENGGAQSRLRACTVNLATIWPSDTCHLRDNRLPKGSRVCCETTRDLHRFADGLSAGTDLTAEGFPVPMSRSSMAS